jgi:hypothetical protein
MFAKVPVFFLLFIALIRNSCCIHFPTIPYFFSLFPYPFLPERKIFKELSGQRGSALKGEEEQ